MTHQKKQALLNRLNFAEENLKCSTADKVQAIKSIELWKKEIAAIQRELGPEEE